MKKTFNFSILPVAVIVCFIGSCVKTRQDNINYYNSHINQTVSTNTDLTINEFCAHSPAYLDSDATPPVSNHWVEIFNPSDSTVVFSNTQYYMSDDSTNPGMYKLDTFSIAANGFVLVMTDSPQVANKTHMHANFHTSKTGGFIGLYKLVGGTYITLTSHVFAAQTSAYSEGRYPDNGTTWYDFAVPTPLAPNSPNGGFTLAVNQ